MSCQLFESDPLGDVDGETPLDAVPDVGRQPVLGGEGQMGVLDLRVRLEWNVTANHVVEKDPQAPDCQ